MILDFGTRIILAKEPGLRGALELLEHRQRNGLLRESELTSKDDLLENLYFGKRFAVKAPIKIDNVDIPIGKYKLQALHGKYFLTPTDRKGANIVIPQISTEQRRNEILSETKKFIGALEGLNEAGIPFVRNKRDESTTTVTVKTRPFVTGMGLIFPGEKTTREIEVPNEPLETVKRTSITHAGGLSFKTTKTVPAPLRERFDTLPSAWEVMHAIREVKAATDPSKELFLGWTLWYPMLLNGHLIQPGKYDSINLGDSITLVSAETGDSYKLDMSYREFTEAICASEKMPTQDYYDSLVKRLTPNPNGVIPDTVPKQNTPIMQAGLNLRELKPGLQPPQIAKLILDDLERTRARYSDFSNKPKPWVFLIRGRNSQTIDGREFKFKDASNFKHSKSGAKIYIDNGDNNKVYLDYPENGYDAYIAQEQLFEEANKVYSYYHENTVELSDAEFKELISAGFNEKHLGKPCYMLTQPQYLRAVYDCWKEGLTPDQLELANYRNIAVVFFKACNNMGFDFNNWLINENSKYDNQPAVKTNPTTPEKTGEEAWAEAYANLTKQAPTQVTESPTYKNIDGTNHKRIHWLLQIINESSLN